MSNLRAVKGMNDLFCPELNMWKRIEKTTSEIFSAYGFQEIRTPILEEFSLYTRGVGEESDIVSKEMYVLRDRDEKILSLRPEGTAGVVRAVIENSKVNLDGELKYFYIGPMFRRERPQKGRLRQFHQIGAEFFGVAEASVDIEVIAMLHDLLNALGLQNLKLILNTLGQAEERRNYIESLHDYFVLHSDCVCSDCQRRLEKNTLRILDCKQPKCIQISEDAPLIWGFLSKESLTHFDEVQAGLTRLLIPYDVSPRLVRGLDYYNRTVFEMVANSGLGSQNAIAAGGRYDGLVKKLGGSNVPAFGFAAGIERIALLLMEKVGVDVVAPLDVVLVYADNIGKEKAFEFLYQLRRKNIKADLDHKGRSVKAQMRRADRLGSKTVLVLGQKEVQEQRAQLKLLTTGETLSVSLIGSVIEEILKIS
jgi:histidyl-tRNA synthetase